ncbi:histidine kinase [Nocardia sp. CDC159]|uniref:histidine kinase n=1 Tax=Nocardia pulmonis TaxID=2951408 RepID=A0A9X2E5C1_9NOCA|nr:MULTISPECIES: histidine kinase [Nocardia]MCM6771883.1 histidine kinase [Nocardia pulmonis]MCM6785459.1 histidine kinase [Nocardia sp. CDC159]
MPPGCRSPLANARTFRDWLRHNPRAVDAAMALIMFAAMAVIGSVYRPGGWREFDLVGYALTGWMCLPLAARRIAPMTVLVAVTAVYIGYLSLGYLPSINLYPPMVAFYTVAANKSPSTTTVGALLLAAGLFYSGLVVPELPMAAAAAQSVAAPAVLWVMAGVARRLNLRNRQLAEATEQLRREQEHRVELAVAQERLQIARELHDAVAHHISVISLQAGLARYVFDSDPDTARAAVRTIGDTSRETLDDLRRVLKLLRPSEPSTTDIAPAEIEPAPGLARLEALLDRVRGVGVNAGLRIIGPVDDLPSGLQTTVYRIIQESLTNVIKHAGRCEASVTVRRDSRHLRVTVSNRGNDTAAPPSADGLGCGHGLLGMRERARLYGGTVTAGPRADGGYAVELIVPWPAPGTGETAVAR